MRKLRNESLSLDETIPYDEAELEDLNQFNSEVGEDIQGLFKLPNIPTNQDTDISQPHPLPLPQLMKSQTSSMSSWQKMQQMIVTVMLQ